MENENYATEHAKDFLGAVGQRAGEVGKFFNKVYENNLSPADFNYNDVFPIPEKSQWYDDRTALVPRQGRWQSVNKAYGGEGDSPVDRLVLTINCNPEELEPIENPDWRLSEEGDKLISETTKNLINGIIDRIYVGNSKYYDSSEVATRLSRMARNFLMELASRRAADYQPLAPRGQIIMTEDARDLFESLVKVGNCEGMKPNEAFAWALAKMGQYSVHPGMAANEARKLWEATDPPYSFYDLIAGKNDFPISEADKYPNREGMGWLSKTLEKACQIYNLPLSP